MAAQASCPPVWDEDTVASSLLWPRDLGQLDAESSALQRLYINLISTVYSTLSCHRVSDHLTSFCILSGSRTSMDV